MAGNSTSFDIAQKNNWLLKVTCIYWLTVKIIGWRMFTANRLFPTAPVFESFDKLPVAVHVIIFLLSLLLIALAFFFPKNKFILAGLLIVEISSCLLDQNRWQPWEYQCIFIVFIFLVNRNRQAAIIPLFTFILVSTYFYSGCNKLNVGFLDNVWVQMMLRSFLKIPVTVARQPWLYYCGYLLALFELVAGAALLFLKTRKTVAKSLILMHLFVLILLGPFGLNYNAIIWPWNIAMIGYLYIIFIRKNEYAFSFKPIFQSWNKLVFICWGILPMLGIFGYWDGFLSSSIYSGKSPRMVICIRDASKCRELKPFYNKNHAKVCDGGTSISLLTWSLSETNVVRNPELRVLKQIQKKLEKQYAGAGLSCFIFITGKKQ
jgi:hypothetical protein